MATDSLKTDDGLIDDTSIDELLVGGFGAAEEVEDDDDDWAAVVVSDAPAPDPDKIEADARWAPVLEREQQHQGDPEVVSDETDIAPEPLVAAVESDAASAPEEDGSDLIGDDQDTDALISAFEKSNPVVSDAPDSEDAVTASEPKIQSPVSEPSADSVEPPVEDLVDSNAIDFVDDELDDMEFAPALDDTPEAAAATHDEGAQSQSENSDLAFDDHFEESVAAPVSTPAIDEEIVLESDDDWTIDEEPEAPIERIAPAPRNGKRSSKQAKKASKSAKAAKVKQSKQSDDESQPKKRSKTALYAVIGAVSVAVAAALVGGIMFFMGSNQGSSSALSGIPQSQGSATDVATMEQPAVAQPQVNPSPSATIEPSAPALDTTLPLEVRTSEPDYATMTDAELQNLAIAQSFDSTGPSLGDAGRLSEVDPGAESISVEANAGTGEVSINGYRDEIASALLANYPSRGEMMKALEVNGEGYASKEQIEALSQRLGTIESSIAVISRMVEQQDTAGLLRELNALKEQDRATEQNIQLIADSISRVSNAVRSMGGSMTSAPPPPQPAPTVAQKPATPAPQPAAVSPSAPKPMESTSQWYVRALTKHQAFIGSRASGKTQRVAVGSPVRGCGTVKAIVVEQGVVETTQCGALTR